MDFFIGSTLKTLLPIVRRRGRRRDEEELACVGQRQVSVPWQGVDRSRLSEIDATPLAHDGLAVPYGSHCYGIGFRVKGDENATERLQRGPSMDDGGLGNEVSDGLQVIGPEDGQVVQVGDE